MKVAELVPAVEAARELAENTFPQYGFSPVYLCEKREFPVGWFQVSIPDRETEHIKAFSVIHDEMMMLTFTYPSAEKIKWKSIILYSFGTWRDFYGKN